MVVVNFNTLRIYSVHHIFKRVQKLNKVKNYCLMCGGMTRNRCGGAFSERALTPTLIFFTRTPPAPRHTHTRTVPHQHFHRLSWFTRFSLQILQHNHHFLFTFWMMSSPSDQLLVTLPILTK